MEVEGGKKGQRGRARGVKEEKGAREGGGGTQVDRKKGKFFKEQRDDCILRSQFCQSMTELDYQMPASSKLRRERRAKERKRER